MKNLDGNPCIKIACKIVYEMNFPEYNMNVNVSLN